MKSKAKTLYLYRDDDGEMVFSTSAALRKNEMGLWDADRGNPHVWTETDGSRLAVLLALPKIKRGAGPVRVRLTVKIQEEG